MTTRMTPWPPGMPCWADTMTEDVPAAQAFYAAVLGWSFGAANAEFGGYSNASLDGRLVAGMGPLMEGTRSAWTIYLATEDIDATAAAVTAGGGTVLGGPHAVGDLGHMLVASDPTGAVFGAWQAGGHTGAQVANEPGSLMWEELRSTDPGAAISFYERVFGYETRPMDMAGPDYVTFHLPGDEAPMGGMGGMFGDAGPSRWLLYFAVADAAAAKAAALAHGGRAGEGNPSPYGFMQPLTDPAGVGFVVIEAEAQEVAGR